MQQLINERVRIYTFPDNTVYRIERAVGIMSHGTRDNQTCHVIVDGKGWKHEINGPWRTLLISPFESPLNPVAAINGQNKDAYIA